MKCLTITLLSKCFSLQHPRTEHPILILSKFKFKPALQSCIVWFLCTTFSWRKQMESNQTHSHVSWVSVKWEGQVLNRSLWGWWKLLEGKCGTRAAVCGWAGCVVHEDTTAEEALPPPSHIFSICIFLGMISWQMVPKYSVLMKSVYYNNLQTNRNNVSWETLSFSNSQKGTT